MLVLAVLVLPAVVVVAFAVAQHADELPLDYPDYLSAFGLVVELFVAAQAPVLMSRDLRYNTVPLYFSRPITRGDYVRARFGAMAAAMLLLMAAPLVVLYLGAMLGGMPPGHNTAHFLYGLVAAVLYALVFSAIGLLIAASTPRRGFGVAAVMGFLVVSLAVAAILYGLAGGGRARCRPRRTGPPCSRPAGWSRAWSPSSSGWARPPGRCGRPVRSAPSSSPPRRCSSSPARTGCSGAATAASDQPSP